MGMIEPQILQELKTGVLMGIIDILISVKKVVTQSSLRHHRVTQRRIKSL
jgi:hypothetical protein